MAIIGAGPSGCYAPAILPEIPGVEISMLDRLPTPHGLARSGGRLRSPKDAGDQPPGVPGCHAAREFAALYNGHPDYADADFGLTGGYVVIIGNSNVAIKVARMLVRYVDELDRMDMAAVSIIHQQIIWSTRWGRITRPASFYGGQSGQLQ